MGSTESRVVSGQTERHFPFTQSQNLMTIYLPILRKLPEGVFRRNRSQPRNGQASDPGTEIRTEEKPKNCPNARKRNIQDSTCAVGWENHLAAWNQGCEGSTRKCSVTSRKKNGNSEFCSMYFVKWQYQHSLLQPLYLETAFRKESHFYGCF